MGKQGNGIEMAKLIEDARRNMPLQLQAQTLSAQSYFAYFRELVKSGFTEEQALEIIKARGLN